MSMPPPSWRPPYSPPVKKKPPILLIIGIILAPCLCCPIFAAILFPVFAQARWAAKHTMNMTRMRQMATYVQLYSVEHQNKIPVTTDYNQFETALRPYATGGPEALRDAEGKPFLLNTAISGKSMVEIKAPESTPLLREEPQRGGSSKIAIGYLDSHVRTYSSWTEAVRVWQQSGAKP